MNETVPADIAAAITAYGNAAGSNWRNAGDEGAVEEAEARFSLELLILHHLRNADEMKAALERIEQGA